MKKLLFVAFLLCIAARVNAQTIDYYAMSDMVHLSAGQVNNLLINTGKFKVNDKQEVLGQILTSYQTMDKNKTPIKGETLVIGAYNTAKNGEHLHTITYKSIYPEYIYNLIHQIEKLGYKKTLKGTDPYQTLYIYDNTFYHVTVVLKRDGSINTLQIRQKELGIEP